MCCVHFAFQWILAFIVIIDTWFLHTTTTTKLPTLVIFFFFRGLFSHQALFSSFLSFRALFGSFPKRALILSYFFIKLNSHVERLSGPRPRPPLWWAPLLHCVTIEKNISPNFKQNFQLLLYILIVIFLSPLFTSPPPFIRQTTRTKWIPLYHYYHYEKNNNTTSFSEYLTLICNNNNKIIALFTI